MNLIELTTITNCTQRTIEYLRNIHLLPSSWSCCQQMCHEVKCHTSDKVEFRCNLCNKRYSIRSNSIFYNVHICLRYLLLLTYLFASNTSVSLAARFMHHKVGRRSIMLWYGKLRDVLSVFLVSNPIALGGPDSVVEIDETCLGRKRKYHRGAFRGSGQKWVIGIVDRNSKQCHIQLVPNRTRETLLPIIELHIPVGTVINTDEAPVYRILNQQGFEHYTVCHKQTYVAPDGTHTNMIEGIWSHLKQVLKEKRGVTNDKLPAHIDEFLYRWNRKNEGEMYDLILHDICVQYPV